MRIQDNILIVAFVLEFALILAIVWPSLVLAKKSEVESREDYEGSPA